MVDRTVDLVIRAKNEATAVLEAITASLNKFSASQGQVGTASDKTGSAMDKLTSTLAGVSKAIGTLNDFGRVTQQMTQLGTAAEQLGQKAGSASIQANKLAGQIATVERAQATATARTTATTEALRKQAGVVAEDARALKSLDGQIAATQSRMAALDARSKSGGRLTEGQNDSRAALERQLRSLQQLRETQTVRSGQSQGALGPLQSDATQSAAQVEAISAQLRTLRTEFNAVEKAADSTAAQLNKVVTESNELREAATAVGQRLGIDVTQTNAYSEALEKLQAAQARATAAKKAAAELKSRQTPNQNVAAFNNTTEPTSRYGTGQAGQQAEAYRAQLQAVQAAAAAKAAADAEVSRSAKGQGNQTGDTNFAASRIEQQNAAEAYSRESAALDALKAKISQVKEARAAASAAIEQQNAAELKAAEALAHEASAEAVAITRAKEKAAADRAEAEAAQAAGEAEARHAANLANVGGGITGLIGHVTSLVGAYVGLYQALNQVGAAFQTAVSYEAAQVRITQALGGSSEQGAAAFQHIVDNAKALKVPILEAVDNYGKFIAAVKGTSIEGEKATRIFDNLQIIGRGFKLDSDSLQRGTVALRDLAASGQLSLRYLNQFDRAVPVGLLAELAKSANVGAGSMREFFEAVHKGQVGLDVLEPALASLADQVKGNLPTALKTAQSTLVDFQNAVVEAQLAFTSGGFLDAVVEGLNTLSTALRSDAGKQSLRDLGALFGVVLRAVSAVIPYARELFAVLAAYGGLKVATAFTEFGSVPALFKAAATAIGELRTAQTAAAAGATVLAAAEGELAAAEVTATATTGGLAAVLGALTGPIGIILAIGAGAAALYAFVNSSNEAAGSGEAYNRMLGDMKAQADAASTAVGSVTEEQRKQALPDAEKAVRGLRDQYNELFASVKVGADQLRLTKFFHFDGDVREDEQKIQDFLNSIADGKTPVEDINKAFGDLYSTLKTDKGKEVASGYKDLTDKLGTTAANLSVAAGRAEELHSKMTALDADQNRVNGAFDKAKTGITATSNAMKTAAEAAEAYESALKKLDAVFPELEKQEKAHNEELAVAEARAKAIASDVANTNAEGGGIGGIPAQSGNLDAANLKISEGQQAELAAKFSKLPGYTEAEDRVAERVFHFESGGKSNASASKSSDPNQEGALGTAQFIRSTFIEQFKKSFGDLNLSDSQIAAFRLNPQISEALGKKYLQEQGAALAAYGSPNDSIGAKAYLGYNIGTGDAKKVLQNPDAKVKDTISQRSYDGNKALYGDLTNAQAVQKIEGIVGNGQKLNSKGLTALENRDAENTKIFDKTLRDEKDKATPDGEGGKDKKNAYVEAAGRKYTDESLKQNTEANNGVEVKELTKEQEKRLALIKQTAQATYEANHKDEDEKAALEELTTLEERRKTAIEAMNAAEKRGDTAKVEEYKKKVKELTDQLKAALPAAAALVDKLGDQKGTLKLEQTKAALEDVKDQSNETAKTIANDFVGDATSAIEGFFQDISKGKNAMDALKDAFLKFASSFLKQIAEMILKKALFSAIGAGDKGQGGGIFGGLGSLIGGGGGAAVLHGGGLVGGTSMMSRSVSPMWFANAPRYHDGGFPGLKADEVPIIAQKGEQVMSKSQLASNGRANAGSPQPVPQKNILVMGDSEVAAALAGSHGEAVVMSHIKRNASTVGKLVNTR